jgi:prolyl oligopeptidase
MRRLGCAVAFAVLTAAYGTERLAYPLAERVGQFDELHGVTVADPYRWLETTDSGVTQAWLAAQNEFTRAHLAPLPYRREFAALVGDFLDLERYGLPEQRGRTLVYRYNRGRDEQDSLWTRTVGRPGGRALVDAAALSTDGTVAIGDFALSPDGRTLAWSTSDGGSDWRTWRFRDVASGRDLPDVIAGTKFTALSWQRDGRGVFYSRYPRLQPEASGDVGYDDSRPVSVWHHALGTVQADDVLIYDRSGIDRRDPYAEVTVDGRYLLVRLQEGYQKNAILVGRIGRSPRPAAALQPVFDRWDAWYEFLGNRGTLFYFSTTNQAPTRRVIAVDLGHPEPDRWREIVPAGRAAIEAASLVGDQLVVHYIEDVRSVVRIFDRDGRRRPEVALPGAGTVDLAAQSTGNPRTYFSYSDFATPPSVFSLDPRTGEVGTWRRTEPRRAIPALDVRRVFYPSRDGTRIPLTLVQRQDLPRSGVRPTVLYGYGGFNIALLPAYSAARLAWISAGGTYAVANLRGGGEYGEEWHDAGTRLRKQNVFDDFIAAAEWLQANDIADPRTLAIWGGSNGGLLVGAVLNQRPALFAAAVPAVGVMDMLRYHLPSANARQWSSDFGIAENPAEFRALAAYSPYHNLRPGTCYPPVLVLADANDDRVSPWHSYKYAAALQHAQGCARPTLLRIENRTGHGGGTSRTKTVEHYADQWAFVAAATGLLPPVTPAASR